ncbi:myrosinase 1-like [Bradysia coprophila]|uniref:myrosinase 1-like n=1 Tax=Bradysia coprophila TaxID=38358 RepID=UPI00187DA5B3|nr:myrosinase 1-like [Bradysia coprophila]
MKAQLFAVCLVAGFCLSTGQVQTFPPNFLFGSASASYQVEGGWDADGKGPSIWDELTHKYPDKVYNRENGDIACNSYELYKEDVQLLKDANMDFYRFSISWSRVMSGGDNATVNEAGLQYYDNLINELIANDIQPMITLYHWDLPQAIQEIGGLTNPLIVRYFEDYADLVLKRYSDRVKYWSTFNEPIIICQHGYGNPDRAPFVYSAGIGVYLCSHNLLLAHGKIYDLFDAKYRTEGSKMGIVISCGFSFPLDENNPDDVAAADRAMQFSCGMYGHPIFSRTGGYPPIMVEVINELSKKEGRAWSRLPYMSAEVRDSLRGKSDYYGLNYYSSGLETASTYERSGEPSFWTDQYTSGIKNASWPVAKSTWLVSVPEGLRGMLNWIKNQYDNPEIIITENGWSDDGELEDTGRIAYLRGHLKAVLDAIDDGVNVTGHTTWSLLDNFEWMMGYSERFGIHYVDFDDPARPRTPKASVAFLRNVIQTRIVPDE